VGRRRHWSRRCWQSEFKNPHYLSRVVCAGGHSKAAWQTLSARMCFVSTMLPVLVSCAEDRVPDVEFNVGEGGVG